MLAELTGMPDAVQALQASGTVTVDDYRQVFKPVVERLQRAGTRMRLLYQFGSDFDRITAGALWADARLGVSYVRLLDGCAVVTDIDWIREPARAISIAMPCPTRVYGNAQRDDAVAWLISLPTCVEASAPDMAKAYVGGTSAALGSLGMLAISAVARRIGGADVHRFSQDSQR